MFFSGYQEGVTLGFCMSKFYDVRNLFFFCLNVNYKTNFSQLL